jgi:hypothetical protein
MTGRYAGARSLCYGTALLLAPLVSTPLYRLSPDLLWGACAAVCLGAAAVMTPFRPFQPQRVSKHSSICAFRSQGNVSLPDIPQMHLV